jgi:hypothetical protein
MLQLANVGGKVVGNGIPAVIMFLQHKRKYNFTLDFTFKA